MSVNAQQGLSHFIQKKKKKTKKTQNQPHWLKHLMKRNVTWRVEQDSKREAQDETQK